MATRRSRLQIKPNIGPRGGAKTAQTESEKQKEKVPDVIKSPTRTISSPIKAPTKDPEPKENKKPEKNVEDNKVTSEKGPNTEVEESIKSPKGQKPQYTALRAKIKAKPNLNLAGKPRRATDETQAKCPPSPLKSPRPNIPPTSLRSPPPRPNIPPPRPNLPSCPSPVKHISKPELNILRQTEEKEEKVEKPKQVRRHTKIDISKNAPLDKTSMKMSDLIFWNPNRNFMSSQIKPEKPTKGVDPEPAINPLLQATEEENQVDEPKEDEEEEEEAMPVPQVKIGPDGSLIINEESLVVNTKKPVIEEETETINETENTTTYASFRKPRTRQLWSNKETEKFYYALSSIGTDFTLMLKVFPNKTRTDLKKKFRKEDKENRWKIEKALKERKPFDMDVFKRLDELVEEEKCEKEKEKEKTKKAKIKKVEPVEEKSTAQSCSVRRSKRKDKGMKKMSACYFDTSNEDFEDDEDDFVKPTPSKVPKGTGKKVEESGKSAGSGHCRALDQSEIVQAIRDTEGENNEQGPIILVYNKPEDPTGETVIHVYRMQPQFSHLAPDNGSQPIIVDGNSLQWHGMQTVMTAKDNSVSNISGGSDMPLEFLSSDADQVLEIPLITESSEPFVPQNVMTLAQNSIQGNVQTEGIPISESGSHIVSCVGEPHSETAVEGSELVNFTSMKGDIQTEVTFVPVSETEIMDVGSESVVENSAEQRVFVEQVSTIIDVNIVKEDT
ncbi:transcription factor TFIIIB component B'' homolog [Saccostrea echinata]|uniref:transcription factor TFIIIB component B'' homolog n=1 Tax=Saccostrea echinata TaxID=191078 RepID=UPI002A80790D|nr:transcription factor TFIIIB component B'' homolog [Saccostrea echinata]